MQTLHTVAVACALLLQTSDLVAQGRSEDNKGSRPGTAGRSRAQQALDSRRALLSRAAAQVTSTPAELAVQRAENPLSRPETAKGRMAQERARQRQPDVARRQPLASREIAAQRGIERRTSFAGRDAANNPFQEHRKLELPGSNSRRTERGNESTEASNGPSDMLADRLLAKRLADIDHVRDVAIENGNDRLLEQADRLEELARQQFDRRTTGEKLHANEIFKPVRPEEPGSESIPHDAGEPGVAAENHVTTDPSSIEKGRRRGFFSFNFLSRAFRGRKNAETE